MTMVDAIQRALVRGSCVSRRAAEAFVMIREVS